jgi:hypothetical protein
MKVRIIKTHETTPNIIEENVIWDFVSMMQFVDWLKFNEELNSEYYYEYQLITE